MQSVGETDRVLRVRAPRQVLKGTVFVIVALVVHVACGGPPANAPTSSPTPPPTPASTSLATGWIADKQGDVGLMVGYLDGLAAGVARDAGTFLFSFALAEPIPAAPEIPNGWDSLGWSFCLDMDKAADPKGYPFAPSTAAPCEFIIQVRSSGGPLTGELMDRRALQDGGDAVLTPLDASIDSATVTVSVPVSALSDPASFTWVWFTTLLDQLGTDTYTNIDVIPATAAPWPPL